MYNYVIVRTFIEVSLLGLSISIFLAPVILCFIEGIRGSPNYVVDNEYGIDDRWIYMIPIIILIPSFYSFFGIFLGSIFRAFYNTLFETELICFSIQEKSIAVYIAIAMFFTPLIARLISEILMCIINYYEEERFKMACYVEALTAIAVSFSVTVLFIH